MKPCDYFLVEYVPLPWGDLSLPIGLILLESSGKLVQHGMTGDWRAVRCLDPRADRLLLNSLPGFWKKIVEEHPDSDAPSDANRLRQELLRRAESSFGTVQIAPPRGVETEDPEREFDRLFEEHVASRRTPRARSAPRAGSRRWIQAQVRQALERHRLVDRLQRNVPVDQFTAPGDGFHIDFCYRPNGVTKYLHALSLEHDWNQAKVLSYTFGKIRARMPATMTAIVADADPLLPPAQSCRRILLDSEISIQPVAALEEIVKQIQRDLGPVA
ncbi:MAG: DUF3037 domain-containing protein [Acidobacteria bacterium]|nr:DUF3037 domain-containing protein [Acidobacteriota bacterium]